MVTQCGFWWATIHLRWSSSEFWWSHRVASGGPQSVYTGAHQQTVERGKRTTRCRKLYLPGLTFNLTASALSIGCPIHEPGCHHRVISYCKQHNNLCRGYYMPSSVLRASRIRTHLIYTAGEEMEGTEMKYGPKSIVLKSGRAKITTTAA